MPVRGQTGLWINKGGDSGEHNVKAYGAEGDGVTDNYSAINDAITAATTNGGYIYFPQGTYRISDNLLIDCEVAFTEGAKLLIDNGIVVNITHNINAGAYQIFSGNGTVSFLGNYLEDTLYPQWWGVIGDANTNNTNALNACFSAANTGGIPVIFTRGLYYFDDTIYIGPFVKLIDMTNADMIFTGSVNVNKPAIVIGDTTGSIRANQNTYYGLNVTRQNMSTWASEDDVGIKIYNAYNCYFTNIRIGSFCIGLQCIAKPSSSSSRGFAYNQIGLNILLQCMVGVDLTNTANEGSYVGWTNQNIFYGGRFSGSTSSIHNTLPRYGVRIKPHESSTYKSFNNNVFYAPCFEMQSGSTTGEAVGILLTDSVNTNRFENIRDENNDYAIKCTNSTYSNTVTVSYGTGAILDTSSYTGSNLIKTTRREYKTDQLITVFDSGNLASNCMYSSNAVVLPAPIFYTRYNTGVRTYGSSYLSLTPDGVSFSSGTSLGIGIRVDTSIQKSFTLSHNGTETYYYFVCYDANGNHLSADSGTHLWVLDPARSISTSTYFVSSGRSYYSQQYNSLDFNVSDNVHSIDIIININSGKTIRSFSLKAFDCLYSAPVLDVYQPVGGWGECIGTAPPVMYWKSYEVGRIIYNVSPSAGSNIGWVCISKRDTTLTVDASSGATVCIVGSTTGMQSNDIVGIRLDNGNLHWTTIASVDSATQITIASSLPHSASASNAVHTNRWRGFGSIES